MIICSPLNNRICKYICIYYISIYITNIDISAFERDGKSRSAIPRRREVLLTRTALKNAQSMSSSEIWPPTAFLNRTPEHCDARATSSILKCRRYTPGQGPSSTARLKNFLLREVERPLLSQEASS